MILVATLAALGATSAALTSGYLFGARAGRSVRAAMGAERDQLERERAVLLREAEELRREMQASAQAGREAEALRGELHRLTTRIGERDAVQVGALREELRNLSRSVREREHEEQALRHALEARLATLSERATRPEDFGREVRRALAPLLARENDTRDLREMVRSAVGPMLDGERIGKELARLEHGSAGDLTTVLEAIAREGGFSAVVVSDDAGLPLAATRGTHDVETISGSSSLVFTMAERALREGRAPLRALVSQHADGHFVLHRIFTVDGTTLLLTAVARGRTVTPDALDPALGSIERALARRPDAA